MDKQELVRQLNIARSLLRRVHTRLRHVNAETGIEFTDMEVSLGAHLKSLRKLYETLSKEEY